MSLALNPMTLPLTGQHLIEASAGTGKTWTIASLYVRLVLGMGGPAGRALRPREILVLTFTRSATRELVDRIRARLVQARACLEGPPPSQRLDPFLEELLAAHAPGPTREQAVWRLDQAASGMDDAAVLTIDAWVQRLLNEHLLPPGQPGVEELLEDDGRWIIEAVRDYWRQQVYPLEPEAMQAVADLVDTADDLAQWLVPALEPTWGSPSGSALPPLPTQSLQCMLDPMARERARRLKELKAGWVERAAAIESWFAERLQINPATFSKSVLRDGLGTVQGWCRTLRLWATSPSAWLAGVNHGPPDKRALRSRLTPAGLMKLHVKAHQPADEQSLPTWAVEFERLVQGLDELEQAHAPLALHALGWVAHHLRRRKLERRAYTFDDLLTQARHGLAQSPAEAARVCLQYPVAMVDEFQDTSPEQLDLLLQVYRSDQSPPHALLLIGDPKQSIYRFRGADIHGYLQTRRRLADNLHTLDCNRRSVEPLVRVVNRLFEWGEERAQVGQSVDAGAFLHGSQVPFVPVRSAGPAERLVGRQGPLPVFTIWTEPQARTPAQGMALDAAYAAQKLAQMLADEAVGFLCPQDGFRRLQRRDCCVLVRSRREADAMRAALARQGISSAYLSERGSVLESVEASDLLELLRALMEPTRLERARRVWGCASMGLSMSQLAIERDDEALWDERIQGLQRAAWLWQRQGVLPAIRHFVQAAGLARRALSTPDGGERRLSNWMHLAEWLQGLSESHRTPADLLQAYAAVVADPSRALQSTPGLREATLMRLESDQDVVQVVTIHKSKGLQYPVVWLPFGVGHRDERPQRPPIRLTHVDGRWVVTAKDDAPATEDPTFGQLEVLREDVRLLYVALTRAVHQVWLGACPRKPRDNMAMDWHQTALGHLVSGGQIHESGQAVTEDLRVLCEALEASSASDALPVTVTLEVLARSEACLAGEGGDAQGDVPPGLDAVPGWARPDPAPQSDHAYRPARIVDHPVDVTWRVSSYSALVQGAGTVARFADGRSAEGDDWRWDEDEGEGEESDASGEGRSRSEAPVTIPMLAASQRSTPQINAAPSSPWHQWPSSAAFGQFLHECLEAGAMHGFLAEPSSPWRQTLRPMITASAWSHWASGIEDWLAQVVAKPLLRGGRSLSSVTSPRAELEFWMPLQHIDTRALDRVLCTHLWPGQPRPPLKPQTVQGLLMGFADLVFELDGQYAVLDYKSNRLGPGPQHYGPADLTRAALAHRYDAQAALYLLALHRLLAARMGAAYDPQQHLDAAHLLFLRGIDHPQGGLLTVHPQPSWLHELDSLLGSEGQNDQQGQVHGAAGSRAWPAAQSSIEEEGA